MKRLSPKVPIILAAVWFAVCFGTTWFSLRVFRADTLTPEGQGLKFAVMAAVLVFSIVMMAVIRSLSLKSQVKWLAIISKVLLIFYSVTLGVFSVITAAWLLL